MLNDDMSAPWRIEMFGGLRAIGTDREVTRFRSVTAGSLLAYLAFHIDHGHSRDVLVEMFWPGCDPEAGRLSLRVALSSLRHQLEPPGLAPGTVLIADRASIRLNPQAVVTDVGEFQTALKAAAVASSDERRTDSLRKAVELYKGELLAGHYEDWVIPAQLRLQEQFLDAARTLVTMLDEGGETQQAVVYAQHAAANGPTNEGVCLAAMRLLERSGKPGAALRQYRELERALRRDLGTVPSPEGRAFAEHLGRAHATSEPEPAPSAPKEQAPLGGVVTFLVAALEQAEGGEKPERLEALQKRLRAHNGRELEMGAGYLIAAFPQPLDALSCAVAAQRALAKSAGGDAPPSWTVRLAVHTDELGGREHRAALDRARRLAAAGSGGQILCSEGAAGLIRPDLLNGVALAPLGAFRIPGAARVERLFQATYPDMPVREFPPVKAEPARAAGLPLSLTRFFGREKELSDVQRIVGEGRRLVSLVGPPGSGKTRLAIEAARGLAGRFGGAVWFVPLQALSDPTLIAEEALKAMGVPRSPQADATEQLVGTLADGPALLVFDNMEQLLSQSRSIKDPDGARILKSLLERAPTLTAVATSRRRLDVDGERLIRVPPLPVPAKRDQSEIEALMECPSVELFVDRAQAVKVDFQITERNSEPIAKLCTGLEGIPLAIEIAASRVNALPPAQMLEQIERRLEVLVSRRRDADERHRTLVGAVDWSYRVLSPEVQRFFARLSVFRGAWDLEAAQTVCEEPMALEYLTELADSSLVIVEEHGEALRYRMLEMLREFGQRELDKAEEREAVASKHLDFFLQLAGAARPEMESAHRKVWFDRLDSEQGNIRAALELALESEMTSDAALTLCNRLGILWEARGHVTEGRRWFERALAQTSGQEQTKPRGEALVRAGMLARRQGDYPAAQALYEEGLAAARELGFAYGVAQAANGLGTLAGEHGDFDGARARFEECLAIWRELGNQDGIAASLANLAMLAQEQEDLGQAQAYFEEALAIFRELDNDAHAMKTLTALGRLASYQEDWDKARVLIEESLEITRKIGDQPELVYALLSLGDIDVQQGHLDVARARLGEGVAIATDMGDRFLQSAGLQSLGMLAVREGDHVAAGRLLKESLGISFELGDRMGVTERLRAISTVEAAAGRAARAVPLLSASEALREAVGYASPAPVQRELEQSVKAAKDALGEEAFAAAWAEGEAMDQDQAVAFALQAATQ